MAGINETISALAATLYTNSSSGATASTVVGASAIIYAIEVDNTLNSVASYVRLWNSTGAITVGTTVPDDVIYVPATSKITILYPAGKTFGTGIKEACVTVGGTTGNTAPTNAVVVEIAYT